jgi:RES domain-containing protein
MASIHKPVTVFRIAQTEARALDLSGFGAFKYGGRWNNKGTYMLYASMNSSLAYLETLVHLNDGQLPSRLFVSSIQIDEKAAVYRLPDADYPGSWQEENSLENKLLGDKWMADKKYLAIKVKSTVNPFEFNFLLNPLFPDFDVLIRISAISPLNIDPRLIR